jgi:hypothetical protein
MARQPARQLQRRRRLPRHAHPERLEAAQQQPGWIGRRDDPRVTAPFQQALGVLLTRADDHPEQRVVMAGQDLRGGVHDEVRAVLQRAQQQRAEHGVVDRHPRARGVRGGDRGVEVRERQQRVRARLKPHQVGRRRWAGLVEADHVESPPAKLSAQQPNRSEVAAIGDRDRRPGGQRRQRQRTDGRHPGRE